MFFTTYRKFLLRLTALGLSASLCTFTLAQPARPFIVAPTIEGILACDEATRDPNIKTLDEAQKTCRIRGAAGSAAVNSLLDTLEPGGSRGRVQVGYTLTLPLLDLYERTPKGWSIDNKRLDIFLRLLVEVRRPVVVYLSSSHFDSQSPLADELLRDPQNLMRFRDGKPPLLDYFGFRIAPYTLQTDPTIPVNRFRFAALKHVAKRLMRLPKAAQERIVAITLAGELHHLFTDFANGMGNHDDVRITDYSPASIAGFQKWLEHQYGDIGSFRQRTGLNFDSFAEVPAPSKDISKERLNAFGEHYDAYADGILPLSGWLWDPKRQISKLDLYLDGHRIGPVARGFNRLDVYRALEEVDDPNVGFRHDLDFSAMQPGTHRAQIVAEVAGERYSIAEIEFTVMFRDQRVVDSKAPYGITSLKNGKALAKVRYWLDLPKTRQSLYFNPLARDWNTYRSEQVRSFLTAFHQTALNAGLPADKLYSHQIVSRVNSTWNPQLFAIDATIAAHTPWKQGLNMYGGAAHSPWMSGFLADRRITDYGVPEFNPQQWKRKGIHLAALQSHRDAGARFVSPYYFSVVPERFKAKGEHGVNRMELSPNNPQDGSDQFYQAIIEFAKQ